MQRKLFNTLKIMNKNAIYLNNKWLNFKIINTEIEI